ncbi:SAM-dependent methyltransferase [Chryseotalea sanaruensis]|uniref:site-specific DNA-methyltransferase (adenine-specific) n=1 Tax=Chryseotalea sanaruensis TaxID=2482724 RepID=A0A401U8N8_9BACT|nr:N-6 DNA methylase [Chryseotalea sanaruensis]GCC51271.1 SAM-dependent methyltransferase [Chryseotalea sanaruensis]
MIDNQGVSFGLTEVKDLKLIDHNNLSISEVIAIENALNYKASYIYFRRFKDRPAIPQVYIYDFTSGKEVETDELITLHQRLYSSGHVPMFFVFSQSNVRIFNCYERPARGKKLIYKPLETIQLASDVLFKLDEDENERKFKAFSGKIFDNGTFWEVSPYSKEFLFGNSAYEKLLTELKQALRDIVALKILPARVSRKIMVVSILIKYLEERTDDFNNSVFPRANEERKALVNGKRKKIKYKKSFFEKFAKGATKFTDVLKSKGSAVKLFDYLAKHFNGGVFQFSESEKGALKKSDLTRFAHFLEGELAGIQYVFWKLYFFNDLPVELISNIYEEFLEKEPGVVYTPPYLVNFLLDEALPLADSETDFKVLDPACGSGVFLVGAYRRLVYRWRRNNKWKDPSLATLKRLLKENIYGSDKDPDAVNLSIFSLSLALCDELTPLQIWEDLEFDALYNQNLFDSDFFDLILQNKFKRSTFDLVIGNPPFEAKLTQPAKKIDSENYKNRLLLVTEGEGAKSLKVKLPDNQIALLFLEESIKLTKQNSLVCLIQPSGPLLYNNTSSEFRRCLLLKYDIPQIIDFTHLSRVLFGKNGDVATAAIFVKNQPAKDKGLLHITARRTKPNKEKIFFELDAYDFHYVPRKLALYDNFIWKANFLGGNRIHQFIKRLSHLRTLGEFIIDKKWISEEGFMVGGKKAHKKAEHLTNSRSLPADAFTELGIDNVRIYELKNKLFYYLPNPKIFKAPHLLIKEIISNDRIPVEFRADDLTFQSRIVGIHAPNKDVSELKKVEKSIKDNKLYPFYIAATSGQYLINKSSAILKQDIDNLPFPENLSDLGLDAFEKILLDDFWNHLLEFRRYGETSQIATKNVTRNDLLEYADVYCKVLNSVYSNLKYSDPLETNSYICFPFYFNKKPTIKFDDPETAEQSIEKLVIKTSGVSLRLTRIVRLYHDNIIYIIKPKKLRFWIKSIALRDADETFSDLRKQGF